MGSALFPDCFSIGSKLLLPWFLSCSSGTVGVSTFPGRMGTARVRLRITPSRAASRGSDILIFLPKVILSRLPLRSSDPSRGLPPALTRPTTTDAPGRFRPCSARRCRLRRAVASQGVSRAMEGVMGWVREEGTVLTGIGSKGAAAVRGIEAGGAQGPTLAAAAVDRGKRCFSPGIQVDGRRLWGGKVWFVNVCFGSSRRRYSELRDGVGGSSVRC